MVQARGILPAPATADQPNRKELCPMLTQTLPLPQVQWGKATLSRLLLGHNPVKGYSHHTQALDDEMRAWHTGDLDHGLELLARCEACGVDTVQWGGAPLHTLLTEYTRRGGRMQWVATFYGNSDGDLGRGDRLGMEQELSAILAVNPPPIAIQHFGEKTDRLYFDGKLDILHDRMKRLRDTGLLVGVGTHLCDVAEEIASRDWDIDFFQLSCHTVYSNSGQRSIDREHEVFLDIDRARVLRFCKQVSTPCLVFKVLGAHRKCGSPAEVRAALESAYRAIKPQDVVLVGMWQKHLDQVGQNTAWVREILAQLDRE